MAPTPKLRVAVLIDSFDQPAWVREILATIRSSTYAELSLVVRNSAASNASVGFLKTLVTKRGIVLWKAYETLDRRLFRASRDPFVIGDTSQLLADVPRLDVEPEVKGTYSQLLRESDLGRIREHGIDVALRFGFGILRGPALKMARYGVWSYHHGDNQVNRGGPAGCWEVLHDEPITGSILQVLTDDLDAGRVIYRSWAPTYRYSVHRNRCNLYWKTAQFVPRKLRELHDLGEAALASVDAPLYRPYSRPLYKSPTNGAMLRLLPGMALRIMGKGAKKLLYRDEWTFAWRMGADDREPDRFCGSKLAIPKRGEWWTDPFPVEHEGRYYVFVEHYPQRAGKAHISVMELDEQGQWKDPRPVLKRPYHLSYPFVFQVDGTWYMVPESAASRAVELYRCVQFPDRWDLEKQLLQDVDATDPTLHRAGERWWLFVNTKPTGCFTSDELSIFFAEDLRGPWTPHARNPVKSDARSSRPAGRLFTWNGDLYRPAQDCSHDYGSAIVLNRVVRLTPDDYQEEAVHVIGPQWDHRIERTHTLNRAGKLTVIDAFRRRARWLP